jgi:23S rRNA pseudouridine955/2504/2580 synthase
MVTNSHLIRIVSSDFNNLRLDYWLKKNFPDTPYFLLCKLIRKGVIRVNGSRFSQSKIVQENDKVKIPNFLVKSVKSDKTQIFSDSYKKKALGWIYYIDKDIIVLNKPRGLPVQGGTRVNLNIDLILSIFKFDYLNKPKLVHRIDKNTSGLLLIARTLDSAKYLTKLFKTREINKFYITIVEGNLKKKEGIIDNTIKDKENLLLSRTLYKVIKSKDNYSLVVAKPLTGRKHQIRKHFSQIGSPILGDLKYSSNYRKESMFNSSLLNLHAFKLIFNDINGIKKNFSVNPPEDMMTNIDKFGFDLKNINFDFFSEANDWPIIKNVRV